jgi:hypothetical protein
MRNMGVLNMDYSVMEDEIVSKTVTRGIPVPI